MRTILVAFSLLLSIPFFSQGQSLQVRIDSLHNLLSTQNDTSRLATLRSLVNLTFYSAPVEGEEYMIRLEQESRRLGKPYYEGYVKAKRVERAYSDFNSDAIFEIAEDAEAFTRKHKLHNFLFTIQQTVAQRYIDQNNVALALAKAQRMYEEAMSLADYQSIARASAVIGNAYSRMNIPEEALKYLNESLRWLDRNGDPTASIYVDNYRAIATEYYNGKDYDAVLLYTDSMRYKIEGILAVQTADFSYDLYVMNFYRAMTSIYTGSPDKALAYIREAEKQLNPNWPEFFHQLLNEFYEAYYYEIGDNAKALDYNERLLTFYSENQLETSVPDALWMKGNILYNQRRYQEAAESYALGYEKRQETTTHENQTQINELRTLYDLDKVEMLAEQDRLRLRSSWYLINGLVIAIALLLIVIFLVFRNKKRIEEKNRNLVRRLREQDQLDEQLEAERSKVMSLLGEVKQAEVADETVSDPIFSQLETIMREQQPYIDPQLNRVALASMIGTNERYLSDSIRNNVDMTVSDYINSYRLRYARRLLSDPSQNYTIESVALDSGFGSRSTLHQQFRKHYGLSPNEFRQLAAEK